MLRRNNHEGDAEQRVRTCRIDAEGFVLVCKAEIHECAFRLADPVYLLLLDIRQVIHGIQAI